jgi:2-keto-3-deoxy-L-rhamnonate aldolase RhmA
MRNDTLKYREWFERVQSKLRSGAPLLGTWITIPHIEVTEILSGLPFDWFLIDMEHAPIDVSQITPLLMSFKDTTIIPLVRVPWNDFVIIKRVLDLGVSGIMVPWINDSSEAKRAVEAIRYPPRGIRGVGPRRCIKYGFNSAIEYFNAWNDHAILIAQIETRKGYENLEDILSVDGISGIFVGPADLSASLGMFGRTNTPEFEELLVDIVRRARKFGKIVGIMAESPEFALKAFKLGYNFISLSHDMKFLVEGAKRFLSIF